MRLLHGSHTMTGNSRRSDFGALPVGHQIYLIGGFNEAMAATNTVIVYNTITGTYASGPAMPEPRARFAHAVVSPCALNHRAPG